MQTIQIRLVAFEFRRHWHEGRLYPFANRGVRAAFGAYQSCFGCPRETGSSSEGNRRTGARRREYREMTAIEPGRDNLSLYRIESDLQELMECLEDARERGDEPVIAAIQQGIQEYVTREVKKVDRLAGYIRHCETMSSAAKLESQRCASVSERWTDRVDGLKSAVI